MEIPKEKEIEILENLKKTFDPKNERNYMCENMQKILGLSRPTIVKILSNLHPHLDKINAVKFIKSKPKTEYNLRFPWFAGREVQGRCNLINQRLQELRK